jgi:hypothetical protein
MSTLKLLSFEAECRRLMSTAVKRGWAKTPPPPPPEPPPVPRVENMRICRKPISRAFWRASLALPEPFTIDDLCAASGSDPRKPYVPRNWIQQRVMQGLFVAVGDFKPGRLKRDGMPVILTKYRRCEDFAAMAAVALGDAP